MNSSLSNFFRFVFVILLQVFILNDVQISGVIVPYAYIFFILMLPIDMAPISVLILSFFTGLTIDLFSHTIGIHAAACVCMGVLRAPFLRMITSVDLLSGNISHIIVYNGFSWFLKYTVCLTVVHHAVLFLLETFDFSYFGFAMLRIAGSTIASSVIILLMGYFVTPKR